MKPTLFALTAIGALAAAAPALAQSNYGYGYQGNNDRYYNSYNNRGMTYDDDRAGANVSVDTRIARLDQRLQAGISNGTIDRDEAMRLRAELRDLRQMNRRYGYAGADRSDLNDRLRSVRDDILAAEGGSGYGYNSGTYDRGGAYGSSGYDRSGAYGSSSAYGNSGTYGGGAYDRGYGNGTAYSQGYSGSYSQGYAGGTGTSNGYYGRGGPYADAGSSGTLRVGDAVAEGLYGVPTELRGTYRDGYNYYYRSDGQAIYQIDARSNTVLRVFPMNR